MRLLCLLAMVVLSGLDLRASAQSAAVVNATRETYLCPDCGKLHTRMAASSAAGTTAEPTYAAAARGETVAVSLRRVSRGVSNVLDALNGQRARQGVPSLRYDPQLQAVAERRAAQMAASGKKGHPPGSFAPGTHEGVGWSSSFSPSGVSACYTSDSRMRYAGAAMASGRDGVYFAVVYR